MKELRYTLVSDGTSDRAFLSILTWLLREQGIDYAIQAEWANLGQLRKPPKLLSERIIKSLELYPCELLFVHRDAEKETPQKRKDEITEAIKQAEKFVSVPVVCVIPVRMLEAWLLFNETAIRKAAGNPLGKSALKLPKINQIEKLPNPKETLCELLRQASELQGRKMKQFKATEKERIQRLAQLVNNFSPLRNLPAFQALETEIEQVIQQQGWCVK